MRTWLDLILYLIVLQPEWSYRKNVNGSLADDVERLSSRKEEKKFVVTLELDLHPSRPRPRDGYQKYPY